MGINASCVDEGRVLFFSGPEEPYSRIINTRHVSRQFDKKDNTN